jgi:hypothetical protein
VFGCNDSRETDLNFNRQGSGDVASEKAFIAVQPDSIVKSIGESHNEIVAYIEYPEREVYCINGAVVVQNPIGQKNTIRTGQVRVITVNDEPPSPLNRGSEGGTVQAV